MVIGKSLFAIGLEQTLFARDLVSGIVPVRIGQRRGFGNQVTGARFLIGAGGTDENVLPGASAKQFQVALNVGGSECDPVDDDIELTTLGARWATAGGSLISA